MAKKIRIPVGKVEETEVDPIEVAQETVSLVEMERNGEIVPAFSFATARGQGTSPEVIPLDELEEYLGVLQEALENGVPERADESEGYVPTPVVLRSELRLADHLVKMTDGAGNEVKGSDGKPKYRNLGPKVIFKSRKQRGAKSQRIHPDRFEALVGFVEALLDMKDEYQQVWDENLPALLEARAAAAAKASEK